jgi:hypothetical protein
MEDLSPSDVWAKAVRLNATVPLVDHQPVIEYDLQVATPGGEGSLADRSGPLAVG